MAEFTFEIEEHLLTLSDEEFQTMVDAFKGN